MVAVANHSTFGAAARIFFSDTQKLQNHLTTIVIYTYIYIYRCVYIYIYISIYIYKYIYIYIYACVCVPKTYIQFRVSESLSLIDFGDLSNRQQGQEPNFSGNETGLATV